MLKRGKIFDFYKNFIYVIGSTFLLIKFWIILLESFLVLAVEIELPSHTRLDLTGFSFVRGFLVLVLIIIILRVIGHIVSEFLEISSLFRSLEVNVSVHFEIKFFLLFFSSFIYNIYIFFFLVLFVFYYYINYNL